MRRLCADAGCTVCAVLEVLPEVKLAAPLALHDTLVRMAIEEREHVALLHKIQEREC